MDVGMGSICLLGKGLRLDHEHNDAWVAQGVLILVC